MSVTNIPLAVVSYDISEDRTRTRLSTLLEGYGDRVQESVFEFYVSGSRLEELRDRLREVPLGKEDSIRVYLLCKTCAAAREIIGRGKTATEPSHYLV